ncbi:MAG: PQQ-binding-like beta-propeller repeat protein [Phycisphaerae bacterium]|jgi:hypothetical protein
MHKKNHSRPVAPVQTAPWKASAVWLAVTAILLLGAIGVWFKARDYRLEWVVRQGIHALSRSDAEAEIERALLTWEQETGPYWWERRRDLVRFIYKGYSLDDPRVRRLLARIAGVDYGDRIDDWRRWFTSFERSVEAAPVIRAVAESRVELRPLWSAPVGLTTWSSSLIALDGEVFVPSLGARLLDPGDGADAVVCIDGRLGTAERIFEPPDPGPRDVVGLAAADGSLFVASANGFVYRIARDGRLLWRSRAGDSVVSAPLLVNLNRDAAVDAVIVNSLGRAVGLDGESGAALWTMSVSRQKQLPFGAAPAGTGTLQGAPATLIAANVMGSSEPEILALTSAGDLRLLAARDGRLLWRREIDAPLPGGAVFVRENRESRPAAFAADLRGRLWSLRHDRDQPAFASLGDLGVRGPVSPIAGLRTMVAPDGAVAIVASTGTLNDPSAGQIALLDGGAVRWRFSVPGSLHATPAVADVNADGRAELIVAYANARGGGGLLVLSATGHPLASQDLTAPPASSPVVSDVNGDGLLDILVADQHGLLHCFETGHVGAVEWGSLGGDPRNTRDAENAYSFGQTPSGYQWRWRPASGAP